MTERELSIAIRAFDKSKAAIQKVNQNLKGMQRISAAVSTKMKAAFNKAKLSIVAMGNVARDTFRRMKLGLLAVVAAGAGLLIFFKKKAVEAAKRQEVAERKLEAAFLGSGKATKAGIQTLKAYADQLQQTTKYQDDQVINAQAMLATFALTDKQVKAATSRVLDMAAATEQATGRQVDLQQIAIAVGKGLTGQVGILSRYGVVISDQVKKSGDFNAILEELDKNFKGIAETIGSTTYQGSMKGVANAWDEITESVGNFIIKSPVVLGFLKTTEQAFTKLKDIIETNKERYVDLIREGMEKFAAVAIRVAKAGVVVKAIISAQIIMWRQQGKLIGWVVGKIKDFLGVLAKIPIVKNAFKGLTDGLDKMGASIPVLGELVDSFKKVPEELRKIDEFSEKVGEKVVKNTEIVIEKQEELQEKLKGLKPPTEDAAKASEKMSGDMKKHLEAIQDKVDSVTQHIQDRFSDVLFARLTQRGKEFKDTMIDIFKDMGNIILRQLTNTMAKAVLGIPMIQNTIGQLATNMLGGFGGAQALAPGRVTQTTAGGRVSGATGVIASGVGRVIATTGAGAPLFATGAGGSISNVAMPTGGKAISGTGALSSIFASVQGRSGTKTLAGAGVLAGGLGGLAASLLPLGEGPGSQLGRSVGSIGGSIIGLALGGPLGAGIGSFAGGILGSLTGGLFGGGTKDRHLPVQALNVPAILERFNIPHIGGGEVPRYRDFGRIQRARGLAVQGAATTTLEDIDKLKLNNDIINRMASELQRVAFTLSQMEVENQQAAIDVIAKIQMTIKGVEVLLTDAIRNGLTKGFGAADAGAGFKLFSDKFKSTIADNFKSSMIGVLENTSLFKGIINNAVTPLAAFLAEQADKDVFNVEGFNEAVTNFETTMSQSNFRGLQNAFDTVFKGFEKIESAIHPKILPATEEITDMFDDLARRAEAFGREDYAKAIKDVLGRDLVEIWQTQGLAAAKEAGLKFLEEYEAVASKIEASLGNAIAAGLETGFAEVDNTKAWESFRTGAKQAIFDGIVTGAIDALMKTEVFKKAIGAAVAPMELFFDQLAKGQISQPLKEFNALIDNVIKVFQGGGLKGAEGLFNIVQGGIGKLRESFFPVAESVSEVPGPQREIRIPRLARGGHITRSGLAFVDRGESFSGVGNDFDGNGMYIDLRGAHINLSTSQNIRRVAEELGERTKFEINKAKQFSNG